MANLVSPYYKNDKLNLVTPCVIAVVLSTFLFYIDEGYYNFKWLLSPGNMFVFVIYVSGFVLGQCITAAILYKRISGYVNAAIVFFVGLPFGFIITLLMLLGLRLVLMMQGR